MASTSTTDNQECFFLAVQDFPPVINGRINMIKFIDASTDLVAIVGMYRRFMYLFTFPNLFSINYICLL